MATKLTQVTDVTRSTDPRRDLPTIPPPFDLEAFAKDSESMLRAHLQDFEVPTAPRGMSLEALLLAGAPENEDDGDRRSCVETRSTGGPSPDQIPFLTASREDIAWFELDEIQRTVLAHVDGATSIALIVMRVSAPARDAQRALTELAIQGAIGFL